MRREYVDFRQKVTSRSRPKRHPECENGASSCIADDDQGLFIETRSRPSNPECLMADMPGRFMLSASVHDTRSLLSINLLITFEGLSENSDNARKGKSLGAPANGARISQKMDASGPRQGCRGYPRPLAPTGHLETKTGAVSTLYLFRQRGRRGR